MKASTRNKTKGILRQMKGGLKSGARSARSSTKSMRRPRGRGAAGPDRGGGTNNFKIFCINPAHKESKPSMYIHKDNGQIHCFGCNYTGSLFTLLRVSKGVYGLDALLYLQKFAIGGQTEDEVRKSLEEIIQSRSAEKSITRYASVELPEHRLLTNHLYLEKRGVTPTEIQNWGMAVVTGGRNIGWILIPIYQDGILRNYFMRNRFGEGKLYGNYPRKDLLAGLDYALDLSQPLYISEGIFDSLAIGRTGVSHGGGGGWAFLRKEQRRVHKRPRRDRG